MKNKKINLILDLTIILSLITSLNSCDDNPVSNNSNPNIVTSVSGAINNLPPDSRIVKGLVVKDSLTFTSASDTVGLDNNMQMVLQVPTQNALYNLRDIISQLGGGISYSNPDTKGNYINFYAFNSITSQITGTVIKANSATYFIPQEGNFHLTYLYSDRNVDISGSTVNIFNTDTLRYNFSLSLGAGYNRITTRFKTIRVNYTEYDVFSGEPDGAAWYYIPNIADSFKEKIYN